MHALSSADNLPAEALLTEDPASSSPLSPQPATEYLSEEDILSLCQQLTSVPHKEVNERLMLDTRPPDDAIAACLAIAHSHPQSGHGGTDRTLHRIRSAVTRPNQANYVSNYVRACPFCQLMAVSPDPPTLVPSAPLIHLPSLNWTQSAPYRLPPTGKDMFSR